jgi:hypothetical protein
MNSDAIIARSFQRMIARAEAEIAEARETIRAKELLLTELRREAATMGVEVAPTDGQPDDAGAMPSLADHIAKVLAGESRPMRVKDITDRLTASGIDTASRRGLLPMVASVLSKRKNRFEQVERGMYKLKEKEGT